MKHLSTFIALLMVSLTASSQFEQKLSVELSGGLFGTFGTKTWMPDWGSSSEDEEPLQIANYKPGPCGAIGFQYNLNRHFSVQANVGIMYTGKWYYDMYDGINYTYFAVWDPITDDLLAEGYRELSLLNVSLGIAPRYYLLPGKKLNPYIFTGLSMNITSATHEDNEWQALHDLDMLDPDDSGPDRAYIENNTGFGINPGLGLELDISDKIGFFISSGIHFILLNEENFYVPEQSENFKAFVIQGGVRLSFLKSKDI